VIYGDRLTQENNTQARVLYDKDATKIEFFKYERHYIEPMLRISPHLRHCAQIVYFCTSIAHT
jgi:hypothetical protein